jgi:hypothetical protein
LRQPRLNAYFPMTSQETGFEKHLPHRRSRRVVGRLKELRFLRGAGACLLPHDNELGDWV